MSAYSQLLFSLTIWDIVNTAWISINMIYCILKLYWCVINQFQVQVRSATEKLRTRIVKEKGLYAVLVGIVRGQQPSVLAKRFCNVPQMQEHIVNNILKHINAECINMCKVKDPSILRNTGADHLTSLNFRRISFELHLKAPTLTQFLKCCIKRADNELALCVLSSLILRYRNDKISQLHHVIGQILDRGGATDEVSYMRWFFFIYM